MKTLTYERLRELLHFAPETGIFTWAIGRRRVSLGKIAGTKNGQKYEQICIDGTVYQSHRLAIFHSTGSMPDRDVDHINGIRSDNRLSNLRDVSRSVNLQNQRRPKAGKKSDGPLGTYFVESRNKWHARIYVNGKTISLGCYETSAEAHEKYLNAKRSLHEGCTI